MSGPDASVQKAKSGLSRMGLYLPLAILAGFIVVWCIVWYMATQAAGRVVDGFISREAERGRDWVCPDRTVSGFPFRIELSCAKLQLIEKGEAGLQREATLAGLSLHSRILAPGQYVAVLSPPFIARQGSDRELTINWTGARASFRGGPQGFGDASFEVTAPVVSVGLDEAKDQTAARAKDFSLHIRQTPGNVAGTDLVFRIAEISLPLLDQRMNNPEPLTLEVQATAPGLVFEPKKRAQDVLEAWRLANGKAKVVLAKANKGQAAIELSGTLGLDAERRLEGALNGRARNIEALTSGFARRTGIDFGALLGRIGGSQGLPVALTLENGRMRFGPFNLVELGPLY
jgi:hypothetical protein